MTIDFEFKTGIVFGIEADQVYMMDEEQKLDDNPTPCWYLHLGILTVAFIFA